MSPMLNLRKRFISIEDTVAIFFPPSIDWPILQVYVNATWLAAWNGCKPQGGKRV
jgi:hypothetical protein